MPLKKELLDLINYVDGINLSFGATKQITNPMTPKVQEKLDLVNDLLAGEKLSPEANFLKTTADYLGFEKTSKLQYYKLLSTNRNYLDSLSGDELKQAKNKLFKW